MSTGSRTLRCALAQIDSTVGDIDGNAARIAGSIEAAREAGAALVVLPELALTGYPPEDLLLKEHFLADTRSALEEIAGQATGIVALVGFPEAAGAVYNAAAVLADGAIAGTYRKELLPNYGVFDEQRYFTPGNLPATISVDGAVVGITICEDIWVAGRPASAEAAAGAEVIVNLSASPYHHGKGREREQMLAARARECDAAVLLCNAVGGQDELVFDGHSVAMDAAGGLICRAPQFEESLTICTVELDGEPADRPRGGTGPGAPAASLGRFSASAPSADPPPPPSIALLEPEEEMYRALVTGVRAYVEKNGFEQVVLGLSGGIDSALVALVAADAIGSERTTTVVMPSPHSSADTQADARAIAGNLGTRLVELPIAGPMAAYEEVLAEQFAGREPGLAEENLQARIRGNLLMALSNKFGWLVLTTGNKSELSVGYSTLYGDMAGGLAVLGDVFKGWVYRLVGWRNEAAVPAPIPASVIDRPPSAELRADQRDDQSLPPYDVLDPILEGYVERDLDAAALAAAGFDPETIDTVIGLVDRAEHKRRQAPPIVRISTKAFGRDRRMPITSRYRPRGARASL